MNISLMKQLLALARAVPEVHAKLKKQPTSDERKLLKAYCKRLDERRVFSVPFNSEVEDCCIASLSQVSLFTEELLSKLEHPEASAAVGLILTGVKDFLDKWHGFRGPDRGFPRHRFRDFDGGIEGEQQRQFFEDLGALRVHMNGCVEILAMLDPKLAVPSLAQDASRR